MATEEITGRITDAVPAAAAGLGDTESCHASTLGAAALASQTTLVELT
jgi:hypothetical protein